MQSCLAHQPIGHFQCLSVAGVFQVSKQPFSMENCNLALLPSVDIRFMPKHPKGI